MTPETPREAGRGETAARFVAEYWRDSFLAGHDLTRVCAHPLAMVLAALDGETDPAQLGIDGGQWDAFRARLAAPATGLPAAEQGLREAVIAYLDHMDKREPYANVHADIVQAGSGGPDFTSDDRHFDGDGCFAQMELVALAADRAERGLPLDDAWAEAEAALPEDAWIALEGPMGDGQWMAAYRRVRGMATPAVNPPGMVHADSPAAALHALAVRLPADPQSPTDGETPREAGRQPNPLTVEEEAVIRLGHPIDGQECETCRVLATLDAALAAPAPGLPAAEQGLREALRRRHAEVCACPFDGSDPGCNLLMDGAELAALAAADRAEPAFSQNPDVPWRDETMHYPAAADRAERGGGELEHLRTALWQCGVESGMDTDGDTGPEAMVAGMGDERFGAAIVEHVRQLRGAYDECLLEPAAADRAERGLPLAEPCPHSITGPATKCVNCGESWL